MSTRLLSLLLCLFACMAGAQQSQIKGGGGGGSTNGEANVGANLGGAIGVYAGKSSVTLNFNTVSNLDGSIQIYSNGNVIHIAATNISTAKILDAAVTYAKIQNGAARSVLGRSANSSGVLADIQAASDGQVLRQGASAVGFGALDLSVAAAVTGTLPKANLVAAVAYEDEANTFTLEQAFSGPFKTTASAISASDVDWAGATMRTKTLTGNLTVTFSNLADDRWIRILFLQDSTGTRTVTWPAGIKWPSSTNQTDNPQVNTNANGYTLITLTRSAGTVLGWQSSPDSIALQDIANINGWAKGDIPVWDGTHIVRFARGTDGQHAISSNGAPVGLAWVDQSASGSTQMVTAAIGELTVTNQVTYIPLEYNGSNGVTATALTNNWDMKLNTFKSVTNFIGTNLTFTLSNVVAGKSIISKFKGLPGTTNKIFIQAVPGVNIKWLGYNTNTYGGAIGILGGYTYALQCFADEATNVLAWVSPDEPAPAAPFNYLPQAGSNYLPTQDRRMAWGAYAPNGANTLVALGDITGEFITGTKQANKEASETNSQYGVVRATGGTVGAGIQVNVNGLFIPTNRVFLFTSTLGFSNAPGTNVMHFDIANGNNFNFGDTFARIGWVASTAGSSQTNWVAQYRSNNSATITVYTSTAMTDQWHTLGVGNTNGSTLVWFMDGVPVATLATPGMASPGNVGGAPAIGQRVTANPGPCFLFWQDFEVLHEKNVPVSTGPL